MSTDLLLLRRYHEHADAFAFRELVEAHAGMVFATARRVTRDAALAEDVAQETFLELARQGHTVRESVGAWLHRVAWRRACNAVRADGTRRRYEEAAAAAGAIAGHGDASWEELEPLIDEELEGLPEKWRGPLVEHFLGGRTQQDVAARLGVSQSTVSRLLESGIDELRTRLRRKGVVAGGSIGMLLAEHAPQTPSAELVASLGKLAVSGVGGGIVATSAWFTMNAWRRWVAVAAVAAAAGIGFFITSRPVSEPGVMTTSPAVPGNSTDAHEWRGRAFCPMCAQMATAGRQPEHGIFVHQENGVDIIYDLEPQQPVPDFHTRYCIPSMDDREAVQVSGTIALRDGRRWLILTGMQVAQR